MTELRVSVSNTSPTGGTFLTPFYFGFHDGAFDLFEAGEAASAGLEQLAEDGVVDGLAAERLAVSPESQGLVVTGDGGPIASRELTSAIIDVDGDTNTSVSYAAMILPSNDAFVGNDEATILFDENGNFLGPVVSEVSGANVYDAGTEVNTELDAAFLNQMGPNTGVDENGVIELHPGFNGSLGNPVGEGDQNILGGTNAFGVFIDPVLADFTQPGAEIVTLHINEVEETALTSGSRFIGNGVDDLVTGSDDRDVIAGRNGWDAIEAGGGKDIVAGGAGSDEIDGGAGNDRLLGNRGNDVIYGGDGNDRIADGAGDDVVAGGAGNDLLLLGGGEDEVFYTAGDGTDFVFNFTAGEDRVVLDTDVITTAEDALALASDRTFGVEIGLEGGGLVLAGVSLGDLTADDFFVL
ncbi:MAG: spondin domain-containing protein [Pseudomonadota bacterium]